MICNRHINGSGQTIGITALLRFTALLALCVSLIFPAGVRAWTRIGPWGGVIHDLAQHSSVSDTIFAGTAEGLYLFDGTFPWQVITGTESMRVIKALPDPARSALYFISPSDPLDFSYDDQNPQGALYKLDLNSYALSTLITGNVSDVVVAGDGDLLAAVNSGSVGMIHRFENGSAVLNTINIDPADPLIIYALHASPGADTVFAVRNLDKYRSNVFISDDTGLTWSSDYSEADTSGSQNNSNFITMGQDSSGVPLIGTDDGRVLSRALGSWNQHGLVSADACSPDGLPPYMIIRFVNDSSGNTFALLREHDWNFWSPNCGPQGFFQMPASASTSWTRYTGYDGVSSRVAVLETTPGYDWVAFDDAGVRRTTAGSGGPGEDADRGIVADIRLSGVTVDPRSDDRCIAFGNPGTKEGRFWASGIYEHRSGTWKRLVQDQFVTPTGSDNQQVIRESGFLSCSISSEDPSIIWIGGNDSGLLRGEQISAGSWTYSWDRKYLRGTNPGDFVYDVVIDPFDGDTVWWATGRGIHITTNDGLTRTQLTADLDIRDLDIEMVEPSQRKYIAGMKHFGGPTQPGLLTSDDGISWTPLLFDGLSIHATAFQPLPWVTDIRALAGPSIDLTQGVALGASTSWYVDSAFNNPTGFPNNPIFQNIDTPLGWDRDRYADAYAVVWRNDLTTVRGLYHSQAGAIDGIPGLAWTDIAASVPYAPAGVAVDPKDGGLLWMATVGGGVYTLQTGNFLDTTIPSFPLGSGLEITDSSLVTKTISLRWTAPGDDGDLPGWADRYELYYRNDHAINSTADFSGAFTVSVDRPQISHYVENLTIDIGPTPQDIYHFAIRALDELSMPSAIQTATAIPSTPNQGGGGGGGGGGCFIATAAYGSSMEPELDTLRSYRDGYLKDRAWGRALLELYYRFSPDQAAIIAESPELRWITRGFLSPIIASLQGTHSSTAIPALIGLMVVVMPIIMLAAAIWWIGKYLVRRRNLSET